MRRQSDRTASRTSSARSSTRTTRSGKHQRPRPHPLPARAQRLPAHRPRQVDLPELRHRRASTAGSATCASTTPIPPRKTSSTSTRSWRTSAGWASTGRTALFYASDYFEQLYEWAEQLIQAGKAYVCDLTADEVRAVSRHAHRAGQEQPLPQPLRRGEPGPVPADAGRRVPRRLAHPAGEDRHGLAQPEPARPGDVPHPPRQRTIAPATSGASTPPTTTPTASRTRIERITHSICTLEFENHRPLYDWYHRAAGHLSIRSRSSSPG